MPTTSKDILFLTLSASTALVTVFLCWALYYLLTTIKDARHIVKSVRTRFDALWQTIEKVKDKANAATTATSAVSQAVIEVVKYVKEKKNKKQENENS
jgi:hypothetical protein